jgi:hypothetical protein
MTRRQVDPRRLWEWESTWPTREGTQNGKTPPPGRPEKPLDMRIHPADPRRHWEWEDARPTREGSGNEMPQSPINILILYNWCAPIASAFPSRPGALSFAVPFRVCLVLPFPGVFSGRPDALPSPLPSRCPPAVLFPLPSRVGLVCSHTEYFTESAWCASVPVSSRVGLVSVVTTWCTVIHSAVPSEPGRNRLGVLPFPLPFRVGLVCSHSLCLFVSS